MPLLLLAVQPLLMREKQIKVIGAHGTVTRNFKHLNLDFQSMEGGKLLKVDAWFGSNKTMAYIHIAIVQTKNVNVMGDPTRH